MNSPPSIRYALAIAIEARRKIESLSHACQALWSSNVRCTSSISDSRALFLPRTFFTVLRRAISGVMNRGGREGRGGGIASPKPCHFDQPKSQVTLTNVIK